MLWDLYLADADGEQNWICEVEADGRREACDKADALFGFEPGLAPWVAAPAPSYDDIEPRYTFAPRTGR